MSIVGKKPSVSQSKFNDLVEEAFERWYSKASSNIDTYPNAHRAFKAGVEWMKTQIKSGNSK